MSGLDEQKARILYIVLAVIGVTIGCTLIVYCCVIRRRKKGGFKLRVILKQPRVRVCTLVSNRDPHYRAFEEYADKCESSVDNVNDEVNIEETKSLLPQSDNDKNKSHDQHRRSSSSESTSLLLQSRFPLMPAFPQKQRSWRKNSLTSRAKET